MLTASNDDHEEIFLLKVKEDLSANSNPQVQLMAGR